ncbi:MAG TPA: hypothetical protein PKE26_14490 [Kiritimatiellia bacterium]|nr:hypothetical protein [Kiritimatiellia bacterium]HMP00309.1 hypothetical protein [Kiritimatiellia bacterium]
MKKDPAIEAIRQTRRELSGKHGHDTRALIEHYRALEGKYAGRILKETRTAYATK